jgi:hypothetical protein
VLGGVLVALIGLAAWVGRPGGDFAPDPAAQQGPASWLARLRAASAPSPPPATPGATSAAPVPPAVPTAIGWVDTPGSDTVVGPVVRFAGWALAADGIRSVDVRVGGYSYAATYGLPRPDVAAARPGFPDNPASGFEISVDLTSLLAAGGSTRQGLEIVAVNRRGAETTLAQKIVVLLPATSEWRAFYEAQGIPGARPFYVLPGVSGVALGGAQELDETYRKYLSPTFAVGMRVPVLYMRTTLGVAQDWRFDANWDIERRCGTRRIADDSLDGVLRHARVHQLPVLVTLNGGAWSDASCGVPEWDVTDHLEEDRNNCQWSNRNEVMADDYLKQLPGAQESPELGRLLTFNVYARNNRHYKKRNLQAAGRIIADFARAHPELLVGVNLDPDNVLNPFFEEKQWFDYNPDTLKQFRHWLAGSGPYAGRGGRDVPDLRSYRRAKPLTLAEVNRLAGRQWARWDDVDPPREFPRTGKPFWEDPWTHEWEVFRRHLVDLHYDELSQWLVDVGVPGDRIHTSQGFMGPAAHVLPFAVRLDSPSKDYDTGGISIEGAVPRHGHLGATVYGPAAANAIRMETPDSLFATFSRFDPGWAIVETNTTDLRRPDEFPDYARAYRMLREAFNFGARYVSPMAWNGSNGIFAGQPGYVAYMAWRNTPFEDAMRDFAVSHAYVPLGTRLWTFGSPQFASDDDWTAEVPATLAAGKGFVELQAQGTAARVVSPARLALARGSVDRLVLGFDPGTLARIEIDGRTATGDWVSLGSLGSLGSPVEDGAWNAGSAGLVVPIAWPADLAGVEALRIGLTTRVAGDRIAVRHIALYPPKGDLRALRTGIPPPAKVPRPRNTEQKNR